DTLPARRIGLIAERIERAVRIGGDLEELARKLMIGFERLYHRPHHSKQTRFQISLSLKQRSARGEMLLVKLAVERLNQVLLRMKVIIRVAERDPRALGNRTHRGAFVALFAKNFQRRFQYRRTRLLAFVSLYQTRSGFCHLAPLNATRPRPSS